VGAENRVTEISAFIAADVTITVQRQLSMIAAMAFGQ